MHHRNIRRRFQQDGDFGFSPRRIAGHDKAADKRNTRVQICRLRLAGVFREFLRAAGIAFDQVQPRQLHLGGHCTRVEPQRFLIGLRGVGYFPTTFLNDGEGEVRLRRLRVSGDCSLGPCQRFIKLIFAASHRDFMTSAAE